MTTLHFLPTGTPELPISAVLRISGKRNASYLFNVADLSYRAFLDSSLRIKDTRACFLCTQSATCMGGLITFSLTRQDAGAITPFQLIELPGQDLSAIPKRYANPKSRHHNCMRIVRPEGGSYRDECVAVEPLSLTRGRALGFRVTLPDAPPKFNAARAAALGVPKGPLFGRLSRGEAISLPSGRLVRPEEVLSEPRRRGDVALFVAPDHEVRRRLGATDLVAAAPPESFAPVPGRALHPHTVVATAAIAAAPQFGQWFGALVARCPRTRLIVLSGDPLSFSKSRFFHSALAALAPAAGAWRGEPAGAARLEDGGVFCPRQDTSAWPECAECAYSHCSAPLFPFKGGALLGPQPHGAWADMLGYAARKGLALSGRAPAAQPSRRAAAVAFPHVVTAGTSALYPSKHRNVVGNLLRLGPEVSVVLDCGEGTLNQLAMLYAPRELEAVLRSIRLVIISHAHADHYPGVWALVEARRRAVGAAANAEQRRLTVVHPRDEALIHFLSQIVAQGASEEAITVMTFDEFPKDAPDAPGALRLRDVSALFHSDAVLTAFPVLHGGDAHGVTLFDGASFLCVFSGDCRPSRTVVLATRAARARAPGAFTLLIHDATFACEAVDEALRKRHSTTDLAVHVGAAAGADCVVLTHFSQRYPVAPLWTPRPRAATPPGEAVQGGLRAPDGKGRPMVVLASDLMAIGAANAAELCAASGALRELCSA
eukprot:gnl/Chilomastix_cuspidata/6480.p1 GENE.gnl/Chilomastix_cuspidata/6480~~gnl/Chilomastix_cuspidata/6480.p1  ORF type:complete len:714 (-),score=181.64 gnl/Chilomastix_cuspidata/6480:1486-3627(-)